MSESVFSVSVLKYSHYGQKAHRKSEEMRWKSKNSMLCDTKELYLPPFDQYIANAGNLETLKRKLQAGQQDRFGAS